MPKAELILEICRKELWREGVLNEDFDIEWGGEGRRGTAMAYSG
jgi:hypothetical protein